MADMHLLEDEDVKYLIRNNFLVEEEMRSWFDNFHTECPDGKLTKDQLIEIHRKFFKRGSPEDFSNLMFRVIDRDGNGTIELMEFFYALGMMASSDPNDKLIWGFKLFDVNKNGFIEKSEMSHVVKSVFELLGKTASFDEGEDGEPEEDFDAALSEAFAKLDIDHDGHISQDEFIQVCGKIPRLARILRLL